MPKVSELVEEAREWADKYEIWSKDIKRERPAMAVSLERAAELFRALAERVEEVDEALDIAWKGNALPGAGILSQAQRIALLSGSQAGLAESVKGLLAQIQQLTEQMEQQAERSEYWEGMAKTAPEQIQRLTEQVKAEKAKADELDSEWACVVVDLDKMRDQRDKARAECERLKELAEMWSDKAELYSASFIELQQAMLTERPAWNGPEYAAKLMLDAWAKARREGREACALKAEKFSSRAAAAIREMDVPRGT
jgi:DNA repair exonuclease SbcCD ATPase subunit